MHTQQFNDFVNLWAKNTVNVNYIQYFTNQVRIYLHEMIKQRGKFEKLVSIPYNSAATSSDPLA